MEPIVSRPSTLPARRRPAGRLARQGVVGGLLLLLAGAGAPPAAAGDLWQWPVEPARVVHGFDPPADPYSAGHRGVDLAAAPGQAVMSPAEGVVTFAGVIAGRGVVVVSHGDVRTTYEPVHGEVAAGALVRAGEVIATLQPFGYHCSTPCLHWGAIRGATYLDPVSFVVPGRSRLLPLWGDGPSGRALPPDPALPVVGLPSDSTAAASLPAAWSPAGSAAPPSAASPPNGPAALEATTPRLADRTGSSAAERGPMSSPDAGSRMGIGAGVGALDRAADEGAVSESDTGWPGQLAGGLVVLSGGLLAGVGAVRLARRRR